MVPRSYALSPIKREMSECNSMQYTQEVHSFFHADTLEAQNAAVSTELENLDAALTATEAREKIWEICQKYIYSSRRFLMRFLEDGFCPNNTTEGYTVTFQGVTYYLLHASEENVMGLTDASRLEYIQLLTELAVSNSPEPDGMEPISKNQWRRLMRKAMQFYRPPRLMSLQEGYQIAHALRFNVQQAEAFLVRVLNNDGFSPKRSTDMIERFCFLCPGANDVYTSQKLQAHYQERTQNIPKSTIEDAVENGTALLMDHLSVHLTEWQKTGLPLEEIQNHFLDWLVGKAPMLDVPGRSAHRIYKNLAVYAYRLTDGLENTPFSYKAETEIEARCLDTSLEFPGDLDDVCVSLLSAIAGNFDNQRQVPEAEAYRYITVDQNGTLVSKALGNRMPGLLRGIVSVTKADLLFLLFFILSYIWERPNSNKEKPYYENFCCFWNLAHEFLEAAHLPTFYAPNLLEYTMLLSIWSEKDDRQALFYPFEIYESLCDSCLPQPRIQPSRSSTYKFNMSFDTNKEKELIEEAFAAGTLQFEGIDKLLIPHLIENGAEKKIYTFTPDGIAFGSKDYSSQIFHYPEARTGSLFVSSTADSSSDTELQRKRLHFVYGLSLLLTAEAKKQGIAVRFRVNFKHRSSLTILEWSNEK